MAIEPKQGQLKLTGNAGLGELSVAPTRPPFLLPIVFVGGMSVMATEMCASRLLSPYFGTSLLIWANIIGFVIIYLAVGYFIGGRIADRNPRASVLYQLTSWAALTMGLVPLLIKPVLDVAEDAFKNADGVLFYGSLIVTLLLFSAPLILMGCISPFAVRLAVTQVGKAGKTAGTISSLSTVGSILGIFIPVLIMIPTIGTRRTMYVFALTLLVFSLLGLYLVKSRRTPFYASFVVVVGVLMALSVGGIIRPAVSGELIYEHESPDNYIQVVKRQNGDGTFRNDLVLNEGRAIHSIYNLDPTKVLTGGPWDYYMVAPFFNKQLSEIQVKKVMIIGLGAGTSAKQITRAYGEKNVHIDGIEVDEEIIKVGRQYFDMNEPNLNAVADDGRYYLITSKDKYDIIGMDAYKQPYIPFHLTTQEFFRQAKEHMTPTGVAVVNAGAPSASNGQRDFRLVEALAKTMKTVFPNVYLINVDGYFNTIIVGTNAPTDINNFRENITQYVSNDLIKTVGTSALQKGDIREWKIAQAFFTDDLAPVEQVIDTIILDYVLGGNK